MFVQCLSWPSRSTRSYRPRWAWSRIWEQRLRTLAEQWVVFFPTDSDFHVNLFFKYNAKSFSSALKGLTCFLLSSIDVGWAKETKKTESDPHAELFTLTSSAGSSQPGHQSDPATRITEATAPEPGSFHSFIINELCYKQGCWSFVNSLEASSVVTETTIPLWTLSVCDQTWLHVPPI